MSPPLTSETPAVPKKRWLGGLVFAILLVVAVLILVSSLALSGSGSGDGELAGVAYCRAGDTFVRLSYLADYASDSDPLRRRLLEQSADYYTFAQESDPHTLGYSLSLALTLDAMGERNSAARTLSQALFRAGARERVQFRPVLLVLTSESLRPEWVESARGRIRGVGPGPLLLADAYRRMGEPDLAEQERRKMAEQSLSLVPGLLTMLAICGFVLAWGVVGLGWAGIYLVRRWWRHSPGAEPALPPLWSTRVLAEALVACVLLQAVVGGIVALLLWYSPLMEVIMIAAATVVSGGGALIWVKLRPPRGAAFGWVFPRFWRQLSAGLVAAGVAVIPFLLLAQLVGRFSGGRPLDDPLMGMIVSMFQRAPAGLVAVMICLVVPPLEETLFRGVLFRGLRSRRSFWWAAAVSALIFAALHGSAVSALPLFLLGVLFAYLCEKHHSLLAPTVAHAAYNAFNLAILMFVYGSGTP